MASESAVRTRQWLENGCNGFNKKRPISNPMSFWTEQDVLLYIKLHDLQICSVYGNIVTEPSDSNYKFAENSEIFNKDRPLLKTTGCSRTGCMFCGYGCHLEKSPTRFEQMKETHPKQYAYIMKPVEEGGFTLEDFSTDHLSQTNLIIMKMVVDALNNARLDFLSQKDKRDWWQMIQLLPSSYNQKRTVQLNYAVLKNIYHARRNHKLDEWHTFCHFIESLPHSELITE